MENLKEFIEREESELISSNKDYTLHVSKYFNNVLKSCAQDTEFPLEDKNAAICALE